MNLKNDRIYGLLIFLIFAWSWNIVFTKIGLKYIPPLWFTFLRLFIGALSTFIFLIAIRQLKFPKRKDLPFIFTIGVLSMGIFQIFFNYGMLFVHAGRSAILTYATPIWVAPISILFFGEKITPLKLIGIILGILGILLLFSPTSFDWSNPKVIIGNGLLLCASLCWAIAMLHTRYGTWHSSPISLLPWQLLISCIPAFLLAIVSEPIANIHWNFISTSIVLFSGLVATALGYWISITVARALPVITTSLALLSVPILTLIFSDFVLNEPLTFNNIAAAVLIVSGLTCIALHNKR